MVPDEEEKKDPTKKISSSGCHNPFVQSNKNQGCSNKQIWRCNVLLMVKFTQFLIKQRWLLLLKGSKTLIQVYVAYICEST